MTTPRRSSPPLRSPEQRRGGPGPSAPPSTRTNPLWTVVARRELATTLRSKAFLISSALLLVALVAMIVVSGLLAGRATKAHVAVVDTRGRSLVQASDKVADRLPGNTSLTPRTYADTRAAERAVRDGKVDVALLPSGDGWQVVGDDKVDDTVASALRTGVASGVLVANAEKQDVDLGALQRGTQVQQRLLDPDAEDAGLRQVAAIIFVVAFYITALGFGMQIASSVTQEKESRVVEILAAAVPIRSLLWGKVVGYTTLAVAQVVAMGVAGTVALLATGRGDDLAVVAPALGWYVVFFVLGFGALAAYWAVAGSLAGRQQDLQATTAPAQLLLFAPYIIAVSAGEGVKTVVSMLPIVSTMLVPARLAEGSVPGWQIAVAIATTVVAAVLMIRLGARIYERTLLRTGSRIGFRAALTAD